jgi:hypothetical protein
MNFEVEMTSVRLKTTNVLTNVILKTTNVLTNVIYLQLQLRQ